MYDKFSSLLSRLVSPVVSCSYPDANERNAGTWDARLHQDFSGLASLSMLSDDILVDHIFGYLMVEDILCLREVLSTLYVCIVSKLLFSG
jgi:hypothetical protein